MGCVCNRLTGADMFNVRKHTGHLLLALLRCMTAGCAPQPEAVPPPEPHAHASGLRFTEVTTAAGLGAFRHEAGAEGGKLFPESMGSGCGFIDYDGDGRLDILLAGGGTWAGGEKPTPPPIWLYRNNGDGTFTLRTEEAGLADVQTYSNGFTVADYDNDGDPDFYLTTLTENLLFRNDGGVFTEVGQAAGVAGNPTWSTAALFFDADRDGLLDLYVGHYVAWTPETDLFCTLDGENKDYCTPQAYRGVPGRFYHNDGGGTFSDATEKAGFLPAHGKTLGLAELDYNRDGWPDVMVANDTEPNQLFVNRGDGTFEDRAAERGAAYDENGRTRAGMGIDAGVVDSTGEVSIFIGHFSREMIGVFHHRGGLFVDRTIDAKIGRASLLTLTFGLFLFDADLDGHLDLFAANGHVQPSIEQIAENIRYAEPVHLFLNGGDGTFEDVAPGIGGVLQQPLVARGAAYGDYDRDGDLDILLTENNGGAHLWRNDLNRDAYLRVHVEGRASSRDAVGTRLVAVTGTHRMEQRIRSGSSYLSASERPATFGLGAHTQVDSLLAYWPSGRIDRFADVPGGQEVHLVEGTGTLQPSSETRASSGPTARP